MANSNQRLTPDSQSGHLWHEITVLRKRLDVAEQGDAVLTYDRLSYFFVKAIEDTEKAHPGWQRAPAAFAGSARKRFMSDITAEVRNRDSRPRTKAMCRELLREGLSPAKYAELAARVDAEMGEGWLS